MYSSNSRSLQRLDTWFPVTTVNSATLQARDKALQAGAAAAADDDDDGDEGNEDENVFVSPSGRRAVVMTSARRQSQLLQPK